MISYNIKFPLNDDVSTNNFFEMSKTSKDAYTSDLLLLLLTQRGERYYEPDYGTNIIKYIFEPNDNITINDIEQEIKRTVALYIPTLTIDKFEIAQDKDADGEDIPDDQIIINIWFTYSEDSFTEQGKLTISI